MLSHQQEQLIKQITGKFNPVFVGVFGSYSRGQQTSTSDIDLLIDFSSEVDLLQIIGLEQELSEKLGIKVDLITMRSINERLKPYILKDLKKIV